MMSVLLMLMIMFFMKFKFNKFLLQMIIQNMVLVMMLIMLMSFSINSLNNWLNIYYTLGMDYFSWGLVLLSIWIMMLVLLVSGNFSLKLNFNIYMNLMVFLLFMLIMCFSSMNLILFYFYFESSLIMVFLLILGWGMQVDRIQAGMYMMLYTLLGSFPLLLIIIYLYLLNFSLMMNILLIGSFNFLIYFMLVFAFLIKMPMYFVHLWLPKAHLEAPVSGSMLLAGVMLKLGGYGLIRVMMMMINMSMKFNKFFILIGLIGGIYASLICLCQVDMKKLVAYSSVVHMSLLMSGMMTLFSWGISGGVSMMIAHGLCSSGLFCLVNIVYDRVHSRNLYINKGLINYFPSLSLMWFLMCSSNISFPPSLGLFSEIMLLNSLMMWSKKMILVIMLMLMFSASYTIYLYSFSQHGKLNLMKYSFIGIKVVEYKLLLLHWIPLNLMFLYMSMFY